MIYSTPIIVHKLIWTPWMNYRKNIVRALCKYCEKSLIRIGRKRSVYCIWFCWYWFSSEWLYGFEVQKYRTNLCYFKSNICSGTTLNFPPSHFYKPKSICSWSFSNISFKFYMFTIIERNLWRICFKTQEADWWDSCSWQWFTQMRESGQ